MEDSFNDLPPASTGGITANFGVALIAIFLVGILAGYSLHPLINGRDGATTNERIVEVTVVVTTTPDAGQAVADDSTGDDEGKTIVVVTATPTPTPDVMKDLLASARHSQGLDDAPVTIIEFSDFKWSYCGRFANDSLSRIREEYVDTGKVRFVYKQYAILGPESVRGSEATECAAEQDSFWPFHDVLFTDLSTNHSSLTDDKLIEFAEQLELDTESFGTCLASGRFSDLITQDRTSIQELGVRGTPAFLINGIYISGAQPYEVFQEVIEEQLGIVQGSWPLPVQDYQIVM